MDAPKARILVVDDEPEHRDSLRRIFERAGYAVDTALDGAAALERLRSGPYSVVLTDLVMPRLDGLALLKAAHTVQPETDVVLMTAYGTVENAVDAMREGAYDFITKPVKRAELLAVVERALEKQALLVENRALKAELAKALGSAGIVGTSAPIERLLTTIRQVAPSSATVLVTGPPGTEKEQVARALHAASPRAAGPFVAVNCAALPETILEAELFGAERGALAPGSEPRPGRVERARAGTLFLDEIGALPLAMQVKLLRALTDGTVEKVGASAPVDVDVRMVAASDVDLNERVREARFREDLYFRLAVVRLDIPALKERTGDIPLLAMHFVKRFADKHKKEVRGFEPGALEALVAFDFPGNVRELESAIERAVVLCPHADIRLEDLPDTIQHATGVRPTSSEVIAFRVGATMEQLERAALDATLRHAGGDKNLTAKLLGISLRTLYRRLGERDDTRATDEEEP
jgi:two-component system response regulator HydG